MSCCICASIIATGKGKKHHKKLNGGYFDSGKTVLLKCIEGLSGVSPDQIGLNLSDSTVCYECCRKLDNVAKLELKTEELKEEIRNFLRLRANSVSEVTTPECSSTAAGTPHRHHHKRPRVLTTSTENRANSKRHRVVVGIEYKSGPKNYAITPSREDAVVRIARKSYPSMAKSVLDICSSETVNALATKINQEIDHVCSSKTDTLFKKKCEVDGFSWEGVWHELEEHLPTFLSVLVTICDRGTLNKPLICMIVSMILKQRYKNLTHVQGVISVLLYGNSANKQIYKCLQPLMICLSYKATLNLLDHLTKGFDDPPKSWRDSLVTRIQENDTLTEITDRSRILNHLKSISAVQLSNEDDVDDNDDDGDENDDDGGNDSDGDDDDDDDDDNDDDDVATDYNQVSLLETDDEIGHYCSGVHAEVASLHSDSEYDTDCSLDTEYSFDAPPFSPCRTDEASDVRLNDSELLVAVEHLDEEMCTNTSSWKGFKVVGDNIDKNIRPSFKRYDNKTDSIHYFHYYSLLDCLDLSAYSEVLPTTPLDLSKLLVSTDDVCQLEKDAITLLSRILVKHVDKYKHQANEITWHIPSKFSKEMSCKSVVVPLGIIRKNENVVDNMCTIMDEIQTYAPSKSKTKQAFSKDGEVVAEIEDTDFHRILVGGDQLTVARCRGAAAARSDHRTSLECLRGVVPVSEDWHTKRIFLMSIYNVLHKSSSQAEKGTLSQLKNLINYSVNTDPSKNMKACEDFMLIVLHSHTVAASKHILSTMQFEKVQDLAKEIVVRYIYFDPNVKVKTKDKKYLYGMQVLTLTLLWHGFNDAIREGDGDRVLTYWKFFAIVFKVTRHHNYFKESVILQLQYHFLLPKRQAEQLKWSRFVNTKGRTGCNVPCDLHLEHLNRRLKDMIIGLHSSDNAMDRAARSIGIVHQICETLAQDSSTESAKHNRASFVKECKLMCDELVEQKIFEEQNVRSHPSFKNMKSLLQRCPKKQLLTYITAKLKKYQI